MHPADELARPLATLGLLAIGGWNLVGFLRWDRQQRHQREHREAMRALARRQQAVRRG